MGVDSVTTPDVDTAPLESADFVRIVTRADGDGVAAAGLLAAACARRGLPFQITTGKTIAERTTRVETGVTEPGETATVAIGPHDGPDDVVTIDANSRPAVLGAAELQATLDLEAEVDPVLALAGALTTGLEPGAGETQWLLERAVGSTLEQRAGIGLPTTDHTDLAYTTACLAPWSGDEEAVDGALEDVEDDDQALASVVALDVVGAPDVTTHAATAIGRFLRPYAISGQDSFATLEGYADVLAATAAVEPGTGVALAMGHDVRQAALECWRRCGDMAHAAVETASTGRYDGLYVVGIEDGPTEPVGKLVAAYRSPEPTVLVVGSTTVTVVTRSPTSTSLASPMEAIARALELGQQYDVGHRVGRLCLERPDDSQPTDGEIIATVREYL